MAVHLPLGPEAILRSVINVVSQILNPANGSTITVPSGYGSWFYYMTKTYVYREVKVKGEGLFSTLQKK
ncbi:hypothetical protein [Mesoflavibacter zeaxanthinifaciens]|uniref:hypothetical protein n=1 Tax=Mesoflavibacter zeaxanthinifaciens TaxID=393060 RepID=UPI003A8F01E6